MLSCGSDVSLLSKYAELTRITAAYNASLVFPTTLVSIKNTPGYAAGLVSPVPFSKYMESLCCIQITVEIMCFYCFSVHNYR